jgi:hypothetical protein
MRFLAPASRAGASADATAVAARLPSHVYVYYRVSADTVAARAAIGALMAEVEARTGVAGRLLARCDDPATWLEVYEPVLHPRRFARTLAACVRRCAADRVAAQGVRHVECFVAPAPARVRHRTRPA